MTFPEYPGVTYSRVYTQNANAIAGFLDCCCFFCPPIAHLTGEANVVVDVYAGLREGEPPIAGISCPTVSASGGTVDFYSESYDPDNLECAGFLCGIDCFEWDVDGQVSGNDSVTVNLPNTGSVVVKHRVIDDEGMDDETQTTFECDAGRGICRTRPVVCLHASSGHAFLELRPNGLCDSPNESEAFGFYPASGSLRDIFGLGDRGRVRPEHVGDSDWCRCYEISQPVFDAMQLRITSDTTRRPVFNVLSANCMSWAASILAIGGIQPPFYFLACVPNPTLFFLGCIPDPAILRLSESWDCGLARPAAEASLGDGQAVPFDVVSSIQAVGHADPDGLARATGWPLLKQSRLDLQGSALEVVATDSYPLATTLVSVDCGNGDLPYVQLSESVYCEAPVSGIYSGSILVADPNGVRYLPFTLTAGAGVAQFVVPFIPLPPVPVEPPVEVPSAFPTPRCAVNPDDWNYDNSVDLTDFRRWFACQTRTQDGYCACNDCDLSCVCFDTDLDGDLDLRDFARIQRCWMQGGMSQSCG